MLGIVGTTTCGTLAVQLVEGGFDAIESVVGGVAARHELPKACLGEAGGASEPAQRHLRAVDALAERCSEGGDTGHADKDYAHFGARSSAPLNAHPYARDKMRSACHDRRMRTPFADRMEEMRALTELSQRAFARRIGMSESAYRKWLKTTSQISGDSTRKVRDHIPISYEEMLGHGPLPEEAKAVLIGWRDSGKRRGRPAKPAQVASDHPGGLEQFHAKLRSLKDGLERLRQLARDLPDVLAQDLSKMGWPTGGTGSSMIPGTSRRPRASLLSSRAWLSASRCSG